MTTIKYIQEQGNEYSVAISTPTNTAIKDAIIVCHGDGLMGGGGGSGGLDYALRTVNELPYEVTQSRGEQFILCIPKATKEWKTDNYDIVQFAYDLLMRDFKPTRVFIAGYSRGGQAAVGYPASSAARKAAITATITIAGVNPGGNLSSLNGYPIYFIHDIGDPVVPISVGETVHAAVGGTQPFEKTAAYGHGVIPDYAATQNKFWDWLLKQGTAIPPIEPPVVSAPDGQVVKTVLTYANGYVQTILTPAK